MKSNFAFINTRDVTTAAKAKKILTGKVLNGGALSINWGKDRSTAAVGPGGQQITTKNLYVTGYGKNTTAGDLKKLFSTKCEVIGVNWKDTFCFINTKSTFAAEQAKNALQGFDMNGGKLKIGNAKDDEVHLTKRPPLRAEDYGRRGPAGGGSQRSNSLMASYGGGGGGGYGGGSGGSGGYGGGSSGGASWDDRLWNDRSWSGGGSSYGGSSGGYGSQSGAGSQYGGGHGDSLSAYLDAPHLDSYSQRRLGGHAQSSQGLQSLLGGAGLSQQPPRASQQGGLTPEAILKALVAQPELLEAALVNVLGGPSGGGSSNSQWGSGASQGQGLGSLGGLGGRPPYR